MHGNRRVDRTFFSFYLIGKLSKKFTLSDLKYVNIKDLAVMDYRDVWYIDASIFICWIACIKGLKRFIIS